MLVATAVPHSYRHRSWATLPPACLPPISELRRGANAIGLTIGLLVRRDKEICLLTPLSRCGPGKFVRIQAVSSR
jgi:hypothetical protein